MDAATVEKTTGTITADRFETPEPVPLTLQDRCDASALVGTAHGGSKPGSCAAQAFVRAVLPSGGELLFCGHHYNDHQAALASVAAYIQDERESINLRPTDTSKDKS